MKSYLTIETIYKGLTLRYSFDYQLFKLFFMYLILNKTDHSCKRFKGSWPISEIESLLLAGHDIIVISTYSNTIKVPIGYELYGVKHWNWDEYVMPENIYSP